PHPRSNLLEFFWRHSAAVSGTNERTHAGTRNETDGNALFFEDFQDADVNDSACKPAAEGKSEHRRLRGRFRGGKTAPQAAHRLHDFSQALDGHTRLRPSRAYLLRCLSNQCTFVYFSREITVVRIPYYVTNPCNPDKLWAMPR